MNNQNNTKTSSNDNQTENGLPWKPTVFSAEEQAELDNIYAEWKKGALAHEAIEKQMSARVTEVWNDNTRRVSNKKGFDLEYSLLDSWSDRIELLLKKEKLWEDRDDELKKQLSENA